MSDTPAVLVTILSVLAGFGAKWAGDALDDRRRSRREREARKEARRDLLRQRRSDFQRQTLLDLQEACMKLIRNAAQQHHADIMAFKQTGKWQRHLLPAEVNEAGGEAQRATAVLTVRILDPEIRKLADELKSACAGLGKVDSLATGDGLLEHAGAIHDALNRRIGETLRTLDTEDDQAARS
jgi:hypothetical protein